MIIVSRPFNDDIALNGAYGDIAFYAQPLYFNDDIAVGHGKNYVAGGHIGT